MARTTRPQTSHYDYTVVSQPLQLPATTSGLYDMLLANPQLKAETILDMWEQQSQTANSSGWFATVRTDTNQDLGVHTDHYGILQNRDIDEAIQDVIQEYNDNCERDGRQGLGEARKKFIVCRDGARVYGRYDFEAYTQSVPKVGDLSLRLTSNNSFDRSCKGNVALEVLRTICANGQKTTMKDFSLTKKHTQQVNTKFNGDALRRAIEAFDAGDAFKVYGRLADKNITQEQGDNILKNLEGRGVMSTKVREEVNLIWENPSYQEDQERNLMNLYNSVTQHLTREVEDERHEYADGINTKVLRALDKLSQGAEQSLLVAAKN